MEENKVLTEQEVFDVLKFAQALNVNPSMWQGGVYTPDLLHQTLLQINNNPTAPNAQRLNCALSNPNNNEAELTSYSEWFNTNNMLYKKAGNYLSNMLSFDLRIPECTNASAKDYKTKEYKEDLARVYKFLDKLNPKREFKKIAKNMLRQGIVFSVLRDDSDVGYAIQQLPSAYCKTTGYINSTLLFDFNMNYFLQPGTSLGLFPSSMTEYYNDIFKNKGLEDYIPSNRLGSRDGTFALWHQTDVEKGYWTFKFDNSIFANIPYLTPIMTDAQNMGILRALQMNKNIASARAILVGEIGFLKETSGGSKADQLNVTPNTLATFLKLVKDGLDEIWGVGGLPLTEIDKYQYEDKNTEMYSDQMKNLAGQSVSLSRVIYCSDKMSQIEAELSLYTDANLMKSLYTQFEDFLNFYVNQKTRKYKFKFHFEGIEYPLDRQNRFDMAMSAAEVGIVLPTLFQSAIGLEPQEFAREMERAKATGFSDTLTQLLSIHTQSGSDEKGGRPRQKRTAIGRGDYDE